MSEKTKQFSKEDIIIVIAFIYQAMYSLFDFMRFELSLVILTLLFSAWFLVSGLLNRDSFGSKPKIIAGVIFAICAVVIVIGQFL